MEKVFKMIINELWKTFLITCQKLGNISEQNFVFRLNLCVLGAAHTSPRHVAGDVSLARAQRRVSNSGAPRRQTDGRHEAPRLRYDWCDTRDSQRHTGCYVDHSHWPETVICSYVYQTRNSASEVDLQSTFNIKVSAASDVCGRFKVALNRFEEKIVAISSPLLSVFVLLFRWNTRVEENIWKILYWIVFFSKEKVEDKITKHKLIILVSFIIFVGVHAKLLTCNIHRNVLAVLNNFLAFLNWY